MKIMLEAKIKARVQAAVNLGTDIVAYELVDPEGRALPPFTAGAHVDFHLPDGRIRQYSLCNDPAERHRYLIAVQRELHGRGGSKDIHANTKIGDIVTLSMPRNNFPLDRSARRHLLIAGGIGITPLMAMMHELNATEADFILHYCARTPDRMAFKDQLRPFAETGRANFHYDGGDPAKGLDLGGLLRECPPDTHLYYCGPPGFMEAVARAARGWPRACVHFEHFVAPSTREPALSATGGATTEASESGFQVKLARRGEVFDVPADKSIVDVLRENGVDIETSCESGLCGTCRTRFLDGIPDHRDLILSESERETDVLICCARALTPMLVLDL